MFVLLPQESLPIPEEEEDVPLEPLNKFERKLAPNPAPAPAPAPDPNLLPIPDLTILVDDALVATFCVGSYVALVFSKLAIFISFSFSTINF